MAVGMDARPTDVTFQLDVRPGCGERGAKEAREGDWQGERHGREGDHADLLLCQKCGLAHHTLLARCRSCKHPRALRSAQAPSNVGKSPAFRAKNVAFYAGIGLDEMEEPHPFDDAFVVEEEESEVVPSDVPPLNPSPPPPPRSPQSSQSAPPLEGLDKKRAEIIDHIKDAEWAKDKELAALWQKRYDALPVTSACITDRDHGTALRVLMETKRYHERQMKAIKEKLEAATSDRIKAHLEEDAIRTQMLGMEQMAIISIARAQKGVDFAGERAKAGPGSSGAAAAGQPSSQDNLEALNSAWVKAHLSDPAGLALLLAKLEAAGRAEAAAKIAHCNPGVPAPRTPPAPVLEPSVEQQERELQKAADRVARQSEAHKPQRDAAAAEVEANAKRIRRELAERSGSNSPWAARAIQNWENSGGSDDEPM